MANIFISYNRRTKAITKALVDDVEALGHTVWFDQELSGGQAWWDQILSMIRRCDLFVFVLDPAALNSVACKREYGYAADLRKPILPILVSEGVSTNLLPPSLSQIEFVDYRNQDRTAALRLARAFGAVPPPAALPDPLPIPPQAPLSYLGSLAAKLETTSLLTYEEQSALVFDLKKALRDPETADDTRTLLKTFRKRRDLLAGIADEMDELFEGIKETSSARAAPPKLEQVAEVIFQEPQEPNVDASSDASTAPQAKIKSRVSNRRREPGWLLALISDRDLLIFATKWTLACLVGEAVGWGVGHATLIAMGTAGIYLFWGGWSVFIGAAVGVTQWILLRRRIGYSQWWILLTTIGWLAGWITAAFLTSVFTEMSYTRTQFLLRGPTWGGITVGTMQWLVLRQSVPRAAWWVLIVSVAGGLGGVAAAIIVVPGGWYSYREATFGVIHGGLSGVITGFGLGILLQRAGKGRGALKQESSEAHLPAV